MRLWSVWWFLSAFGEVLVVGPLACVLACCLWATGRKNDAVQWLIAFWSCAALIYLLKQFGPFSFKICDHDIRAISPPSGHVGISMMFYGQLAILIWRDAESWLRYLAILPLFIVPLVGLAVWGLWWHSPFDIMAGVAVGLAFLAILLYVKGFAPLV